MGGRFSKGSKAQTRSQSDSHDSLAQNGKSPIVGGSKDSRDAIEALESIGCVEVKEIVGSDAILASTENIKPEILPSGAEVQPRTEEDPSLFGVKELKQRLHAMRVDSTGCSEKRELVELYKTSCLAGPVESIKKPQQDQESSGPYKDDPCHKCGDPVGHNGLVVLGKFWHNSCYYCSQCGKKPVGSEAFLWVVGKPYCKLDYTELFATKCAGCGQAIMTGNSLSACEQNFHPGCFRCSEPGCKTVFNGEQYWEYLGRAYCEVHYNRKQGNLCESCLGPINGRFMEAQGRRYHPQHFRCQACSRPLMGKPIVVDLNNQLHCTSCS